jgi:nucleotide-binding universal stress UspA family protein
MKVVLSADDEEEGTEALVWCRSHLDGGDTVLAVAGVNQFGEFVQGIPPFDELGDRADLVAHLEAHYVRPLLDAGIPCQLRLVDHGQLRAVTDVAEAEGAELIVIGKRPHGRWGDAIAGEIAMRLVHRPPCTVVVVPTNGHATVESAAT